MQRWQTRARRWEVRAAERRSKRRLAISLEVVQEVSAKPEANDNDDFAATDRCHEPPTGGNAEGTSTDKAA